LPPEEYRDPGAWSRTDYLLDQGISSSGSVTLDHVEDLGSEPARSLNCRLTSLQHASSARLLTLPTAMRRLPLALRLSEDDAVMLAAMTTGDRTYLTHSLRVGFERTGSFTCSWSPVFISQLLQDVFFGSRGVLTCPVRQPR